MNDTFPLADRLCDPIGLKETDSGLSLIDFDSNDLVELEITTLKNEDDIQGYDAFIYTTETTDSRLFTSLYSLYNDGILNYDIGLKNLMGEDYDDTDFDFSTIQTTVKLSQVVRKSLEEDSTSPTYNYYLMRSSNYADLKNTMGCIELFEVESTERVLQNASSDSASSDASSEEETTTEEEEEEEETETSSSDSEDSSLTVLDLGSAGSTKISMSPSFITACVAISDPDNPQIPPIYLHHKTTTIPDLNEIVIGDGQTRKGAIAFLSSKLLCGSFFKPFISVVSLLFI